MELEQQQQQCDEQPKPDHENADPSRIARKPSGRNRDRQAINKKEKKGLITKLFYHLGNIINSSGAHYRGATNDTDRAYFRQLKNAFASENKEQALQIDNEWKGIIRSRRASYPPLGEADEVIPIQPTTGEFANMSVGQVLPSKSAVEPDGPIELANWRERAANNEKGDRRNLIACTVECVQSGCQEVFPNIVLLFTPVLLEDFFLGKPVCLDNLGDDSTMR